MSPDLKEARDGKTYGNEEKRSQQRGRGGDPSEGDYRVLLKSKVNEKVIQGKGWVNGPGTYKKVSKLTGVLGNVSIFSYWLRKRLLQLQKPLCTLTEPLNPTPLCGMLL